MKKSYMCKRAAGTMVPAGIELETADLKGGVITKENTVVVLLCGGNIDTTVLGRCLERGLAADGRLLKFTVCVSDRPGGIAELTRLIADIGVSVKDIMHDRAWLTNDLYSVKVKVICETRDLEHSRQLMELLQKTYERVHFVNIPNPAKKLPENFDES